MNPRTEAIKALREAEAEADGLQPVLTVGGIEKIQRTLQKIIQSQRRALDWLDAVETP